MSIKVFKVLFPHVRITDLNKSIDRKIILCAYNNSCKQQMGEDKVTIIEKGIAFG